ncbi:chemotaxis protein CheA [Roseixanthobacter glucoisosaccharinicivorans]|uniref:chemotaxis protein CheA n=1 Tax=Roseixanthobacter glucoisosaccharinicivorans TaxID=3119923 RepID=UPI0037294CDC
MNELLQQFLIEARELVAQATEDLLALERSPGDAARLDSAFRAIHTLKGGAGIVDFDAMARALHTAEDALSHARAETQPITSAQIGDYLSCLDQVVQWLDHIEANGAPPADAETGADAIARRFLKAPALDTTPAAAGSADRWVDALVGAAGAEGAAARTALRYRPDPDCFFRGEDPLRRMEALPGLLALRLEPAEPWPVPEELDPFSCRLVFLALLSEPPEAVAGLFEAVHDQVDLIAIGGAGAERPGASSLPPTAIALLEAQVRLLAEPDGEGASGRLSSAGRVAVNVLRHIGEAALAQNVARALDASERAADPALLAAAIHLALAGPAVPETAEEAGTPGAQDGSARTLRIDVERINALVKLTGELTIAKNAVGHLSRLAQKGADLATLAAGLKDQHALLERLMDELQGAVLRLRVLPLRQVFQRFPRLVREISAGLGKSVQLVTEGDATEADKAIVEALFEPLLHVIRNALDHGIEPDVRRIAAGKPERATVRLRAARQGEHVVVEVQDDGGGIDVARIRDTAVARGVATPEAVAALSDAEALDLIFRPGFSTAETVTDLSGRGVGMDAVRASLARLGGRVAVETVPGQGTTVRFTLPFTIMITRVMTVQAGGQAFGIPMDMVVETVRVPRARIARIGAAEAFALRERTVPLVALAGVLGETDADRAADDANVVVIGMGTQLGGLEVDSLGERIDVILQPLDGILSGMRGIAGTTLLGDGRVLLVLDVQEMLR